MHSTLLSDAAAAGGTLLFSSPFAFAMSDFAAFLCCQRAINADIDSGTKSFFPEN
jgi:hypothetical protein